MKKYLYALFVIFLFSCENGSNQPTTPDYKNNELSSEKDLPYPVYLGNSGDKVTGLLGYGFDITGFSDSTSGRSKILDLASPGLKVQVTTPALNDFTLVTGKNESEFLANLSKSTESDIYHQSISLLKLAIATDSLDKNDAFTYYCSTLVSTRYAMTADTTIYRNALTTAFKNDVKTLNSQQLVAKYGTHVLTQVNSGKRLEVIYKAKTNMPLLNVDFFQKNGLYRRMYEYTNCFTGTFYFDLNTDYSGFRNERMIYNSYGSSKKFCGVLDTTDNNPANIRLDFSDWTNATVQTKTFQFIGFQTNTPIPLYDLLSSSTQKTALKKYIDQYIADKSML